jgi:hypothetical protein
MNPANLFSIDVKAHLSKAASHTFGAPGHWPVELVRAALRRGATEVDVQITRNRLQVQDNGPGLSATDLETLLALMEPGQSEALKEEAVESIQNRENLGLLAIFASHPEEILVENASAAGAARLHLRQDRFDQSTSLAAALSRGTRLTLWGAGTHRDMEQEKQLLEAFCRSVPREVRLNHRVLGGQRFLSGQIATLKLSVSDLTGGGEIGIPQTGRICHFRLLDQGIPWHHFTLPPQQGFIFDAALETSAEVTDEMIRHLYPYAHRLYQWLRKRYYTADDAYRDRIEELLFTHCRLSGDDSLLLQFAPFRVLGSRHSLHLNRVKKEAAAGTLYAVPWHKDHLNYNTSGKTVLSLTRQQADLLINHLKIPISFLNPVTLRPNPVRGQWYKLKRGFKRFITALLPVPRKLITPAQLTGPEQLFMDSLCRHLPGIQTQMSASRAPFPAVPARKSKGGLFIRRDHLLVRQAVRAVQEDPRNIEIFVPLILPAAHESL